MNETIQTRYTEIDTPMKSVFGKVYHKYLLYTDRNGRQYGLRAGPSTGQGGGSTDVLMPPDDPSEETPYGRVRFQDAPFDRNFTDYPPTADDLSEIIAEGPDLSETWKQLQSSFHDIESLGYNYSPRGVNSNTIVDDTLAFGGLPPTRRDGSAGNESWENERGRLVDIISTPGLQQLPHTPQPRLMPMDEPALPGLRQRIRGRNREIEEHMLRRLGEMGDREFATVTEGDRWPRIWGR